MSEIIKRGLMTGLGDGYFQAMTKEETENTRPEYDKGKTKQVPSLQSVEVELSYEATPVYLSSKMHSDLGKMTAATITLNAAYLPDGFAEEMTGAQKIGPGAYVYTSAPATKFFRFAFPMLDENGKEVLANFFKCKLEPVGLNPQTEEENKEAQIDTFNITAYPLNYRGSDTVIDGVYAKIDLRVDGADKYDREKLLEQGWYDKTTLEQCAKTVSSGAGE